MTDTLIVATWNLENDGINPDGSRRRRDIAMELLEGLKDEGMAVLLREEELGTSTQRGRLLRQEEAERLGMTSHIAPQSQEGNRPTAVLLDQELFQIEGERDWHNLVYKPVKIVTARLKHTIRPVDFSSVHLCWCDPIERARHARRSTTLPGGGRDVILGGDMNSYPFRDPADVAPLPQWDEVGDAAHRAHRFVEREGQYVPDSVPDEILSATGIYTELGYYAYEQLGQRDALRPTASLWRTDQGPRQRIDRLYTTPALASALLSVEVRDDDLVRFASDHAIVIARFDLAELRRALTEPPQPAAESGAPPALSQAA